jgi:ribonuclease BN (tRNA processing enzyme)
LVLSLSGKRIVYSSDIASAQDLATIVELADVLITECVHPSLDELLSLVVDRGVKSLLITHIPPEMEEKQEEILKRAKKGGIEKLTFAHDGLSITL